MAYYKFVVHLAGLRSRLHVDAFRHALTARTKRCDIMKPLPMISAVACLFFMVATAAHAEPKKEDVPELLKALKSGNAKKRISAADDLGHLGAIRADDAKEAVPVLLDTLKNDRTAGVRKAVATALGRMDPDPQEAVPVLSKALKDKDAGVRAAAATSLGQLGAAA